MERAQYAGLRTALGYRNSTPNNVIIAESKVMLLQDRAEMLARNFLLKNMIYGKEEERQRIEQLEAHENYGRYINPLRKKSNLVNAWSRVKWLSKWIGERRKYEIFSSEYDYVTEEIETDKFTARQWRKRIKSERQLIEEIIENNKIQGTVRFIYTDGSRSKKSRSTGASIVIKEQETAYNISMPKYCSSFTAEAFAVNTALELIHRGIIESSSNYVILTDSLATSQAIENNLLQVYKNRYITLARNIYRKIVSSSRCRIILGWVPAHVGIEGNEEADSLAKEAAQETPAEEIKVPYSDLRNIFKLELWNNTQNKIIKDAEYKGVLF